MAAVATTTKTQNGGGGFVFQEGVASLLGEAIVPNDVISNHVTPHYKLEAECVNLINDAFCSQRFLSYSMYM